MKPQAKFPRSHETAKQNRDILVDTKMKTKPVVIQFPKSRHGQTNAMYKFPFLDTKSSMRDVLNHGYEQEKEKDLHFVDLANHHQRRLATQLYADFCIGSSKMKLSDVISALQVCRFLVFNISIFLFACHNYE